MTRAVLNLRKESTAAPTGVRISCGFSKSAPAFREFSLLSGEDAAKRRMRAKAPSSGPSGHLLPKAQGFAFYCFALFRTALVYDRPLRKAATLLLVIAGLPFCIHARTPSPCPSSRPTYPMSAYDENYSFLKDERCRIDYWDRAKYVPLSTEGKTFLSFGGQIRERYEHFENSNWGQGLQTPRGYVLERYMLHADLQVESRFRVFAELKSGVENGRNGGPRPPDEDRLDLHQAMVDVKPLQWSQGFLTFRAGRQELSFGSSRLVSVREGPNVRQTFDGFRLMVQNAKWRVDAFATRPVETDQGVFNDSNDHSRSFCGLYAMTPFAEEAGNVDLYYFGLHRKKAAFNEGAGREERHSVGTRVWGHPGSWDYNFEGLFQWGSFGQGNIRAWTSASDTGYTVRSWSVHPRFGLKADIASGDKDPRDPNLQTFNALFPKGAYFSEADLIGPSNFVDVHPSVSLPLMKRAIITAESDFFWRESIHDGIYGVAVNLLRSGQANPERYIGSTASTALEFRLDRHTTLTWEYLHFFPGPYLTQSPPGKSVNYVTAWATYKF
jgi:hypothetical protein